MNRPFLYQDQQQRQTQGLVLAPRMRQALKILQVPATDLHAEIQEELQKNPTLEELPAGDTLSLDAPAPLSTPSGSSSDDHALPPRASSTMQDDAGGELDETGRRELDFAPAAGEPDTGFATGEDLSSAASDYAAPPSLADFPAQPYSNREVQLREHLFDSLAAPPPSLQEHLTRQAALVDLPPAREAALRYLIGLVDERGYLSQPLEEAAAQAGFALADVEAAAAALRSLDPPGIGATSLRECLLLQLTSAQREGHSSDPLAARIISEHFELLARRRLPELARKLGAHPEAVQRALAAIAKLDPAPGRRFAADDNRIVEPDVEVFKNTDGQWQLRLNRRYIPRLRLSATYRELIARGQLATEERDYLRERMQAGRELIEAIEQRQHTLERLSLELLELQREFFEHGPAHLRPLTMAEVAVRLGLHETTVSRAAAHKFIKTPHGLFPLRQLFSSGYEDEHGNEIANTSVKKLIADWIATEDKAQPLSDQALLEKLQQRGLTLARRTVTKYREELGLPPSKLRQQW